MGASEVKETQLQIFRERVRPNIIFASEGVEIRRSFLRKHSIGENSVKWDDRIHFSHPKLKSISIFDAFLEKYGYFLVFDKNPFEDKVGFLQEVHEMIMRLNRSIITPNDFAFTWQCPRRNVERERAEIVKGDEKFEREKFPEYYRVSLCLEWIVKP